jgi:hypothetical protein
LIIITRKRSPNITFRRTCKGTLPPRRLTEFINYNDDNNAPVYKTANNSHFVQEKRELVIELEEGLMDDHVPLTKLGSFTIPLNRIDEQCPYDGSPMILVEPVSSTTMLTQGEVRIEVRRCNASRDYVERKKQETVAKISDQIETIVRFNEEEQDGSGPLELRANIQGRGKVSLMHVAIQLQREDLVEKLMEQGANPMEKSELGTPLSLALNLQHRVQDKLLKEKAKGTDTKAQQELYALYQRIADSLRNKNTKQTSS